MPKKTPTFTFDEIVEPRPMNPDNGPITYPLTGTAALSPDALQLYRHQRLSHTLDRDVFQPRSLSKYVTPDEAKAFEPTERMLAAIKELEEARLAEYSTKYGQNLRVTGVHDLYTYASGRGAFLIRVSTFKKHPDDARLLAVLIGADLETRVAQAGMTVTTLRARHENATDFEESASTTALLTLRNVSEPNHLGYGKTTFTGVLTEAWLYPIGVDPLTYDDGETRPGNICTRCPAPHPYAPYLPPQVEALSGAQFVTVDVLPLRPYLVAAPPAFAPITTTPEED